MSNVSGAWVYSEDRLLVTRDNGAHSVGAVGDQFVAQMDHDRTIIIGEDGDPMCFASIEAATDAVDEILAARKPAPPDVCSPFATAETDTLLLRIEAIGDPMKCVPFFHKLTRDELLGLAFRLAMERAARLRGWQGFE